MKKNAQITMVDIFHQSDPTEFSHETVTLYCILLSFYIVLHKIIFS